MLSGSLGNVFGQKMIEISILDENYKEEKKEISIANFEANSNNEDKAKILCGLLQTTPITQDTINFINQYLTHIGKENDNENFSKILTTKVTIPIISFEKENYTASVQSEDGDESLVPRWRWKERMTPTEMTPFDLVWSMIQKASLETVAEFTARRTREAADMIKKMPGNMKKAAIEKKTNFFRNLANKILQWTGSNNPTDKPTERLSNESQSDSRR